MTVSAEAPLHQPTLLEFPVREASSTDGLLCWTARAQNFAVSWIHAAGAGVSHAVESPDEIMLLVLDAPIRIVSARTKVEAAPRSVCILPAGAWRLEPAPGATCGVIVSLREGAPDPGALNARAYQPRDPRIRPVGTPWTPVEGGDTVRVFAIDNVRAHADKPRLKMLQTATLSINWVEYEGTRDSAALSPHAHADFEQGSFGLAGDFVHHLRVPWGANSNLWRDDRHVRLESPSLMVVPVGIIHTSEGVGSGRHLLIDVFSPPRADFIANGWVANASDYVARVGADQTS